MRSECRRCELSSICLPRGLKVILNNLHSCSLCGRTYLRLLIDMYKPSSPLCVALEIRQAAMSSRSRIVLEGFNFDMGTYTCEACLQKRDRRKNELRDLSLKEGLFKNRP